MRTLIAFSLVGTLATTAWARPDHEHAPPGAFRSEVQMRMPVDGRADTAAAARESRPDPWQRAEKPAERGPSSAQAQLPLKSDIAQKAHPGDQREVSARPQALDARAQAQRPSGDLMGRSAAAPTLPIKTEVMMKAQHGDNREPSSSSSSSAAKPADASGTRARNPQQSAPPRLNMTAHDREMICRQAGVCLPQSVASDDTEDKTE